MIPFDVRLSNFRGLLEFAADEMVQLRSWIEGVSGLTSVVSPGELLCQFFDDSEMGDFIEHELSSVPLTPVQKAALVKFRDALVAVESSAAYRADDTIAVVQSAAWRALVEHAQRSLPLFDISAGRGDAA